MSTKATQKVTPMTVAFTPHDRPPRLMRYVDDMPADVISYYDFDQNFLIINRAVFETLSQAERREVLRTHEPVLKLKLVHAWAA